MSATLQTLRVWAEREQALTFFVVGDPRPQSRGRVAMRGGRPGIYHERPGPKSSASVNALHSWKTRVSWATKLALAGGTWAPVPEGVPVECSIDFYFLPARGSVSLTQWSKVDEPLSELDEGLGISSTFWQLKATKPDRDNLDKAVLDTITGLGEAGIWNDDGQVALGRIVKWHSNTYGGALIHLAAGASISPLERPNPESVPMLDFDDGPGLTGFQ